MQKITNNIVQFAVVTPHEGDTIQVLREKLNLGPMKVWDFVYPALFDTTIGDQPQPWSMKLAFGWIGNMQFEIIQPTGGQSLYQKYLDIWKTPGVQHLLIDRGDVSYQKMKQVLAEAGMPVVNEAKTNVAIQMGPLRLPPLPMFLARSLATIFGYTATLDTLKVAIEISKYPPGLLPRQGIRMGVPSYWSDGDQKHFEQLPEDSLITGIEGFIVLVNDIKTATPHYQKIFGDVSTSAKNEITFSLQDNFVSVVQPDNDSSYKKILDEKGEGVRILVATPRHKTKEKNSEVFRRKGFAVIELPGNRILFTNNAMPFHIEVIL